MGTLRYVWCDFTIPSSTARIFFSVPVFGSGGLDGR
jgi:hypothetical protein